MKKLTIFSLAFFICLGLHAQEFAPAVSNPFGLIAMEDTAVTSQVRFADVDNDNDLDAIHFGLLHDSIVIISIQKNMSTSAIPNFGSHELTILPDTETFPLIIGDVGDINNDGKIDLLVYGSVDTIRGFSCAYYENISTGSTLAFNYLSADVIGLPHVGNGFFVPDLIDVNLDGDLDIVLSGMLSEIVTEEADGEFYFGQHLGDFNDVKFSGWYDGAYGMDMPDTFQAALAVAGDLDLDGDVDILSMVAETDESFNYYFFENNAPLESSPSFDIPTVNPFNLPDSIGLPELADVDQDGDLDLFIFQGENGISFFENIACIPDQTSLMEEICAGEIIQVGNTDFSVTGIYEITLMNTVGCDSVITLNLNVIMVNSNVTISDMILYAEEVAADAYQWVDCGTNMDIAGATNSSFSPVNSGNYRLRITKDDCVTESDCIFVTVSSTTSVGESAISLYPNPADQNLIINGIDQGHIGKIVIDNAVGSVVQSVHNPSSQIDVSELRAGLYLFVMYVDTKPYSLSIQIY